MKGPNARTLHAMSEQRAVRQYVCCTDATLLQIETPHFTTGHGWLRSVPDRRVYRAPRRLTLRRRSTHHHLCGLRPMPCSAHRRDADPIGPGDSADKVLISYAESNIQHKRFYSSGNRHTVAIRQPRRME